MISELFAIRRPFLAVSIVLLAASHAPSAQRPQNRTPMPGGQDVVAKDGDRIIVEEDARVQIVRRRAATVRAIFDQAQRTLTLLIDYPPSPGMTPDGGVDSTMSYFDVDGDWPLGERWEGVATVEDYSAAGSFAPGFGLRIPAGVVQFAPGLVPGAGSMDAQPRYADTIAIMSYQGSTGGGAGIPAISFDQAEQEQLVHAAMARQGRGMGGVFVGGGGAGGFSSWSTSSGSVARGGMNVAGGMRMGAQKIRDVAPVYPDEARKTNVQGVVVLEITVGPDGSVANPRVLRSIPLLDEAAVAAVSQWQYQPVLMNGTPVPVVMTVAVPVVP